MRTAQFVGNGVRALASVISEDNLIPCSQASVVSLANNTVELPALHRMRLIGKSNGRGSLLCKTRAALLVEGPVAVVDGIDELPQSLYLRHMAPFV